tara:strand:+ start:4264 stop:4611 length:348 start_codon:yes stop_codon:yes gene_type:complete
MRAAVVDDDRADAALVRIELEDAGWEVDVYLSGAALVDAVRRGLCPDVAVVDLVMPPPDGPTTIRLLRDAAASLPVVALTGMVRDSARVMLGDLGVALLRKPLTAQALVAALEAL